MPDNTILVIDDEAPVRRAVRDTLKYEGYNFCFAENGEEGLGQIQKCNPILIILDLKMPVMNGIRFLERLQPQLQDPYSVIVLTGHGTGKDVEMCYNLGIDAFIRKPFDIYELLGAVKSAIALKRLLLEKIKIEQELRTEKVKSDAANRLKSAILANMSHEVRTPLSAVIGFSGLLMNKKELEEYRDYFKRINRNGTRLLNLINDIMELSEMEAGLFEEKRCGFSIHALLQKAGSDAKKLIEEHGKAIELRTLHADIDGKHYVGDPVRIHQVLKHLLGNAVKFTDEGFVEYGVKAREDGLEFHVRDTGIGIPPEKRSEAFEPFRQLDDGDNRKYGGAGLGLAVARKLAELMGGTVTIESMCGEPGSLFRFIVPCEQTEETAS